MRPSSSDAAAAAKALGLSWQRPNNTEGTAWERIRRRWGERPVPGQPATYLAFPWASWIDAVQRGLLPPDPPLRNDAAATPVATVCQHIRALDHLDALRAAGITDLFWSHATEAEHQREGVRIHPFPLFPVRCHSHPVQEPPASAPQRPLLYAYQGFHPPQGYLSDVRRWLQELPPRPDALVEQRGEWHFEQQVYREQVHGLAADPRRHRHLAEEAQSYVEALRTSVFALCPSGAGPNSIRLWEALGYGAIPVILSDTLRLPGEAALWRQAALRLPETAEAVAALPAQLAALRQDPERLEAMQAAGRRLWQRYGPGDFVADVNDFLAAPHHRLGQPPATAMGPCLSVLMPCRNAGPFLEEAIDSVLADPAVLELLIADGGSSDGSLERIERRCRADRRVRLVSRADHGPADALNRAWPHVRGTVVGWLNADDRYLSGAPSRAVAALAAHPHWLMVYGEGEHIDAAGQRLDRYPSRPPSVGLEGFGSHCFLCQPTVFWRRSLGVLLGPWDAGLRCAFDFDYWIRAFSAVPERIGKIGDLQAQTRRHEATLSLTHTRQAVLETTWLQATRLPRYSAHILLAYATELGEDGGGDMPALLEELRARLSATLPPGRRDAIWATIGQALREGRGDR